MRFLQNLRLILTLAVLMTLRAYSVGAPAKVQKISVSPQDPIQLQVQTSIPVVPQAQVISGPERLIIDVPGAMPGPALRALTVNHGDVKRVRVGLFSTLPPVTRIVLDLNSPLTYRITPISSGFKVTLLAGKSHEAHINPTRVEQAEANSQEDGDTQPTVGWVLQRVASTRTGNSLHVPVVKRIANASAPVKGVNVRFVDGQLEIHAHDATLSDVLFQIQKETGAEIAIPAGTEQERVFVDAGPAPASQVLGELLNGSSLNFVVVGSESDPNALSSVILSRRNGFAENIPSYTPPPAARNFAANINVPAQENPPDMTQPPDEIPPPDETAPQPQPN